MDRKLASLAVTNIVLLTNQKRPPPGFSQVGEINGVLMCYQVGSVPSLKKKSIVVPPRPPPPPPATTTSKQLRTAQVHPLNGVPFEIGRHLISTKSEAEKQVSASKFWAIFYFTFTGTKCL